MEDTSPFSLREGKLDRSKTTRCLQRLEESLQTGSGCSNLHTMTHPWAKIGANLGLMDHLHTSWMTPLFRADAPTWYLKIGRGFTQCTTRRQERKTREARKQCMYNISDFSPGFRAVFPGIEASSFTLQCKIGQPFGEFTTYVIDYHEYPSAKIFTFSDHVLVLCVV
jgi:hypothetical protein